MNDQSKYYSRQTKLIGINGQDKLRQSRVLVIGAGGLGCPVLLYLAAMGIGSIGIIDNDRVDISNLHRQILYSPKDIGKYKSQIAALKISEQNPFIDVFSFVDKLNRENSEQIFKNYDIIVDCTDNFDSKFLVHDACFYQEKKLVQASIYQYEGNLHVFDFSKREESNKMPCLRCLWTKEPDDGCVGTCADVGVLGATAGVLGSLQAIEVSKLILRKDYLKNGEGLFVDLLSQDYEKRKWKKNNDCPVCSLQTNKMAPNLFNNYKLKIDQVTNDFIWIDLRNHDEVREYALLHPGLIQIPLSEFNVSKLSPIYKYLLVCQKGYRSNQLVKVLCELGHENFYSLVDGVQNFSRTSL